VDEARAERMIERLPPDFSVETWSAFTATKPFDDELLRLACPMLLAKHEGCLVSTDEGVEDAVYGASRGGNRGRRGSAGGERAIRRGPSRVLPPPYVMLD
jgi:hypothetical protein